jgi:hypothetical protein
LISSLQPALLLLPAEQGRGLPVATERSAQADVQPGVATPKARLERVAAAPVELVVAPELAALTAHSARPEAAN